MKPADDLGDEILRLRRERGWTLTKLAAEAGIDHSTAQRACAKDGDWRGDTTTLPTLRKIARALGYRFKFDLVPKTPHEFHSRQDHAPGDTDYCWICDGGNRLCKTCHASNAAVTATDCPGRPLTVEQVIKVERGTLDFIGGAWVAFEEER